ncbi:hypothetical protein GUITHDRAFT_151209 [Guillardia theta CCMP2712]|uniref:C2H2-type domain-containing protein n=1 Tax=Guillardia theta (strain CCMP2712) TaxID=905079 RepID=L1JQA0_GUITC|nr:hypothetical protein GUITHDRAFT_151209 [Guillardia theta CCMP2712]EKX50642.1 hypothetical protein GUITHDRAFT_151209 [Guillardia theta CCMP2712]|eukprot:XP_005837622.1 hypothetical protein GUITHDRAFT_151209 [Guillardia theta CCMP2712]
MENLGSDEEEEILEEFMDAHSEQIGPKKFVCTLDGKQFSTRNILRAHFEKNYKKEAMSWYEELQSGHDLAGMEEMMAAMAEMMMGPPPSRERGQGKFTDKGFKTGKKRAPKVSVNARRKGKSAVNLNAAKKAAAAKQAKSSESDSGSVSDSD